MTKIFSRSCFESEDAFYALSPADYLKTMLSFVDGGKLYIAIYADDVSVELAESVDKATIIAEYEFDAGKADVAAICAKEGEIDDVCREVGDKNISELKEQISASVKNIITAGAYTDNVIIRAQRLARMYQLGAPDFLILGERRYLIESIALNSCAGERHLADKARLA